MAEIKTADEQAALDSILDQAQAQAEYWIGLTDMAEKGKWVWQHSNQTLGLWNNWGNGEPNNGDSERCAEIWNSAGKWAWHNVFCDGAKYPYPSYPIYPLC